GGGGLGENWGGGKSFFFPRRFCRTDCQRDRLVARICGWRNIDRSAHCGPDLAAGWPDYRYPRRTTSPAGKLVVLRGRPRACWIVSCIVGLFARLGAHWLRNGHRTL